MTPTIAGLLALGLTLLLIGFVFLRGRGAIFMFYLALCAVGLGYLTTTGAVDDIGAKVLDVVGKATAEKDPGTVPAAAPVPAQ